jgi:uncharacterized protein YkwD
MKRISLFIVVLSVLNSCEFDFKDNSMAEIISKKKILEMVNQIRTEGCNCGGTTMPPVGELEWDYQLERAAIAHSIDMNVHGYFSHTSIDGSSFADRINGTDYQGSPGGENIAMGYQDENAVFQGWLNSPGHCMNMMNASHTDLAVGRSGSYWTMVFGKK